MHAFELIRKKLTCPVLPGHFPPLFIVIIPYELLFLTQMFQLLDFDIFQDIRLFFEKTKVGGQGDFNFNFSLFTYSFHLSKHSLISYLRTVLYFSVVFAFGKYYL